MTPFHASSLVNDLQFEIVKMMTYDLWNLEVFLLKPIQLIFVTRIN
jgi:hypothetical protein